MNVALAQARAIATSAEKIAPYVARFGRSRPVVAVIGENAGTILPDYVIPYGVLSQSGAADVVSICNGSQVLANAGLTRGHRATGHWSTYRARLDKHPDTQWLKNIRYVADGKIVSSAGITAAIPVLIALVEAIGGSASAQATALKLGVSYWGARHDSDAFALKFGDGLAAVKATLFHARDDLGVPLAAGVDEIALR